ncbi:MAG: lipase family protein [Cyanobacteria bacterium P01_F01_bin.13]
MNASAIDLESLLLPAAWCGQAYEITPKFGCAKPPVKIEWEDNTCYFFEFGEYQVVVGEGTDHGLDWFTNLNFWPDGSIFGAYLHQGFSDAAKNLWRQVQPLIDHKKPLWFTGHSLGGATATLMAIYALLQNYDVASLDTFGAPRPFDKGGAEILKGLLPPDKIRRVYLGADIVTRVLFSSPLGQIGAWHPICTPIHLIRTESTTRAVLGSQEWDATMKMKRNTAGRLKRLLKKSIGRTIGSIEDHAIGEYIESIESLIEAQLSQVY